MDGILGAKYVEAGEHVQPGTKLVTLIDTTTVYAVFPLQEDDAVSVSEGMAAEVTLDAFPGQTFSGRVDLVSPLIDSQSGSVSVKAKLSNPGPGSSQACLPGSKCGWAHPPACFFSPNRPWFKKGSKARVYAVVNGRVFGKDVELGRDQGGRYIVVSGAQEKDLVIDSPSPLLKEGEEVDARQ